MQIENNTLNLREAMTMLSMQPTTDWGKATWGSPHYRKFVLEWMKTHDFVAGESAVKMKRELYLPPAGVVMKQQVKGSVFGGGRGETQYDSYLQLAPFMAYTGGTLDASSGMLFRKPVTFVGLEQSDLVRTDNIDGNGTSIQEGVALSAREDMQTGAAAIYVEYPEAGTSKQNNHPYEVSLTAEQVIEKRKELIDNEMKYTLVKILLEGTKYDKKSMSFVAFHKLMVMRLEKDKDGTHVYTAECFIEETDGEGKGNGKMKSLGKVIPLSNKRTHGIIPIWFSGDGSRAMLRDLSNIHNHEYIAGADRKKLSSQKAKPITLATYDPEGALSAQTEEALEGIMENGPYDVNMVMPTGSDIKIIEFAGKDAEVLRKDQMDLSDECAKLSAMHLTSQPVGNAESNAALRTRFAGQMSNLNMTAHNVSEMWGAALSYMTKHYDVKLGKGTIITVEINRDYLPVDFDANALTAISNAVSAGNSPLEAVYAYYKRTDSLPEGIKTFDEFEAKTSEGFAMMGGIPEDAEEAPSSSEKDTVKETPSNDDKDT